MFLRYDGEEETKMKSKRYIVYFGALAVIIFDLVYLVYQNYGVGINASDVTEKIESVMPPYISGSAETRYNTDMPMMTVDGYDYVGIIEIPSNKIKLPVYSAWNERIAKSVPCRYSGSIYNNDMVIGGKNTENNFGCLRIISPGDQVNIIDTTGHYYSFNVVSITHNSNFDTESFDNPLVLFSYLNDISKYIYVMCE